MDNRKMAVQVKKLCKQYDSENVILKDLNLSISKGEMVAIVGSSGSGKSTLLNIIGLISKPSSGSVLINGKVVKGINSKQSMLLRRNSIGYLFQNYGLVDEESVYWNLMLPFAYKKMKKQECRKKIDSLLLDMGMEKLKNKKIHQLSGGEQQRIAIARLILQDSDIILADEPTGSLDYQNRDRVLYYLQQLHQIGKTIIIVTHDPNVADFCERKIQIG